MDQQERKLQQRIARRREKVRRLIEEQETRLASLEAASFLRREDYMQAVNKVRQKLYRLEQELAALDDGRLPGFS